MKLRIRSYGSEHEVQINTGETVFQVLARAGFLIDSYCGGQGTCGKCLVRWVQEDRLVLACQLAAQDGMIIETLSFGGGQILTSSLQGTTVLNPLRCPYCELNWGIALDIGTTTIVGYLLDLATGAELAVSAMSNPQRVFGADVISRIAYSQQNPDGVRRLQDLLINSLNTLILSLCHDAGIVPSDICSVVVAGNTVMLHTLVGISATSIAKAPFVPVFTDIQWLDPVELGLKINKNGRIVTLPCVSGYVGADVVAGLLVSDLAEQDSNALFLDIGTNGEMVLGNRKQLLACSAAAGPALEGANISRGMAGIAGAISGYSLGDRESHFSTIGDLPPRGVCGSGLISVLAELLRHGLLSSSGAFELPGEECWFRSLFTNEDGQPAFVITTAGLGQSREIVLTQRDVREVQLAKGALRAGILTLLKEAELEFEDIEKVYVAGGFGNYMNAQDACRVGIIPAELGGRVYPIGNGAGLGAKYCLLDQNQLVRAVELSEKIDYIELSTRADFQELFMEAMFF